MRRRLAVSAVVLTALAGEWLGHGIAYFRVAGFDGLRDGLGGGVHDYMLPLAVALLAIAAAGGAVFTRTWLALGHRLEATSTLLGRLRRRDRSAIALARPRGAPAKPGRLPRPAAGMLALAMPMACLQAAVYVVQENLERSVHGLPAAGLAPLLDGYGAAAWIQGAVAIALAALLSAALALLRARRTQVERGERLARALWQRLQRAHLPAPRPPRRWHVTAAQLLLGSALWQRPPPLISAA